MSRYDNKSEFIRILLYHLPHFPQVTIDVHPEPNLKDVLRMHNEAKLAARDSYFNIYNACSQIGISKHALNRVTGNFYVFSGKRRQINERSADKVNIGLQMRIPKENKEVPGISKYMDNVWYLSTDAIDIICTYLDAFPKMCDVLAKPDNNIFEDDFSDDPELVPGTYLRELAKFAEKLPHQKIRPRTMSTEYIDPNVAEAVERAAETVKKEVIFKTIKLQTKLHLLHLPRTTIKCPDPQTQFHLFDRVIVATHNLSMPIGSKGTIVSIYSEKDENPLKYENKGMTTFLFEVMFDDQVPNGNSYFGTIGESKVQTVTEQSIINITYGRSKRIGAQWDCIQYYNFHFSISIDQANNRSEATATDAIPTTYHSQDKPLSVTRKTNPEMVQPTKVANEANTAADDEKRTKEMLNNIWNSLKGKNPVVPNLQPSVLLPPSKVTAPDIDLTESLRKCLKITPTTAFEVPNIQQPSPAQLPPPPANWRIEAQIKHLQSKPVLSAVPMPAANQALNMRPPMFAQQNQYPVFMPQPPRFPALPPQLQMHPGGPPQMGFSVNGYPMRPPMSGFRPVAAMPFTNAVPPPFMHPDGGQSRQQQQHYHQNRNNSGQYGYGNSYDSNKLTDAGHGAFIPLQAARKISKLRTINGAQKSHPEELGKKTVDATDEKVSAAAGTSSKPEAKGVMPKKAPRPKTETVAPKAPRIAANFSVNK